MKPIELRKRREYLKETINELETISRNKNIRHLYRSINEFKKSCQHRPNIVKDENGDLLADSHSTIKRWKNYFCQLLNVHGDSDVRQTEMHTAEPLVPESSCFEVEIAIEKLKIFESLGISKQKVTHYALRSTNFLILFGIRKNCHSNGRKLLLDILIKGVIKLAVIIVEEYYCYQLHTKFYLTFFSES
jgi:hypothetical protein